MVASGLPKRIGNEHAREIARMSIAFLKAIFEFQIPHRPHQRLELRIGVHSVHLCFEKPNYMRWTTTNEPESTPSDQSTLGYLLIGKQWPEGDKHSAVQCASVYPVNSPVFKNECGPMRSNDLRPSCSIIARNLNDSSGMEDTLEVQ
ncbi:hypothetical protein X801_06794, partial [Opisthorchis viverrini]